MFVLQQRTPDIDDYLMQQGIATHEKIIPRWYKPDGTINPKAMDAHFDKVMVSYARSEKRARALAEPQEQAVCYEAPASARIPFRIPGDDRDYGNDEFLEDENEPLETNSGNDFAGYHEDYEADNDDHHHHHHQEELVDIIRDIDHKSNDDEYDTDESYNEPNDASESPDNDSDDSQASMSRKDAHDASHYDQRYIDGLKDLSHLLPPLPVEIENKMEERYQEAKKKYEEEEMAKRLKSQETSQNSQNLSKAATNEKNRKRVSIFDLTAKTETFANKVHDGSVEVLEENGKHRMGLKRKIRDESPKASAFNSNATRKVQPVKKRRCSSKGIEVIYSM